MLVLAREFCQYISEGVESVEGWLSRTQHLSEDVNDGLLSAEKVEEQLEVCCCECFYSFVT